MCPFEHPDNCIGPSCDDARRYDENDTGDQSKCVQSIGQRQNSDTDLQVDQEASGFDPARQRLHASQANLMSGVCSFMYPKVDPRLYRLQAIGDETRKDAAGTHGEKGIENT